jgi:hypothetical protein
MIKITIIRKSNVSEATFLLHMKSVNPGKIRV